jgi:hypothetical protein
MDESLSLNCRLIQSLEIGHSWWVQGGEPESSSPSGTGKWETCLWFSTFPERFAGAVGMWKSRPPFGEISKGLVESVGSLVLAFHAFHSPGISTAPSSVVVERESYVVSPEVQSLPNFLPTDSAIEPYILPARMSSLFLPGYLVFCEKARRSPQSSRVFPAGATKPNRRY